MLIELLKFLHLLLILSLTGATIYCLVLVASKKFTLAPVYHQNKIYLLNRIILWLAALAIITGTLLIYPKHFTIHTPWIQTAYVLVTCLGGILGLLIWFAKKDYFHARWLWYFSYLLFALILFIATHDAVTKVPLINLAFE